MEEIRISHLVTEAIADNADFFNAHHKGKSPWSNPTGFFSAKTNLKCFWWYEFSDRSYGITNDTSNYFNLQEQKIYLICYLWQRRIFLRM
jgi:hypothetical protein